jgi:hypothetical protein
MGEWRELYFEPDLVDVSLLRLTLQGFLAEWQSAGPVKTESSRTDSTGTDSINLRDSEVDVRGLEAGALLDMLDRHSVSLTIGAPDAPDVPEPRPIVIHLATTATTPAALAALSVLWSKKLHPSLVRRFQNRALGPQLREVTSQSQRTTGEARADH